jgi:aminopeptidase YwaD
MRNVNMKRISVITALLLSIAMPAPLAAQDPLDAQFEAAYLAWDRGDYVPALEGFARILESPGGARYHERIALITGELYTTTEIAPDGHDVRISADGRYAAYEVGTGEALRTVIVDLRDGVRKVKEVKGTGLVFSPRGDRAAFLAIRESRELAEARAAMGRAMQAGDRQGALRQRALEMHLLAKGATTVVVELPGGKERRLRTDGLIVGDLEFSADGATVYAVAARDDDPSRTDIFALSEREAPRALTDGPGYKGRPTAVAGGAVLVYEELPQSPVPLHPDAALAQRASRDAGKVAILDLVGGTVKAFPGGGAVVAADGSAVAFFALEGEEIVVQAVRPGADASPTTVARTTGPIAGLAISPDGRRVAYQKMPREDWEVYVAATDGSGEVRLTYDIQHDLAPQFVSPRTVLLVKGEGRHRRSYLYDVETGEEKRFFHNNTVRTIAPEYEWAVSRDGTKVVIVSERDGDTVSPERGVYVTDLTRKVTTDELLARVRSNLAAERDLRQRGEAMFAPIADEVRRVVARVSKTKLYEYQRTLHSFGSKHITQPGNRKAIEYLEATLRGWGYDVELQWFEPRPGVRTANVVATLPGTTHPELMYVVGSHFDSVEHGPGADDNTSGTSVLLETARVLKDSPRPATVKFVFFTGEEGGLLGSREFARRAQAEGWAGRVLGALNNDMMGYANDHHLDNTIRYSNAGIRDLQHAAAFLFTDLITYDSRYFKSTDAHALFDAFGDVIGGIGSYPVLANPHYHQSHDVLETVNQDLIRETAKTNTASIMLLASSPAKLKGVEVVRRGRGEAEVAWQPAPEKGIREYRVAYGPAEDPMRNTLTTTEPRAVIPGAQPGWVVSVKAVNDKGLQGWDWASVTIGK